jgi:prepilin-type N-terminal cleavage/methylation domain-containing protein
MSTPRFGRQPGSSQRGGFTLIEVAIALAIFVFGALAIVQIFPPALGVIRNNESRITATQMGENMLAQFKSKTSPPPEAIFDATFNTGTTKWEWQDVPLAVVGTSNKNGSLPRTVSDFNSSALGHFRYIYGEPHLIGGGQTIILNYPQDASLEATMPGSSALEFFLDEVVEGVQINANGYLDFSNAHLAKTPSSPFNDPDPTDPADPTTRRPPDNHRRNENVTYYVSYRWQDAAAPTIIQGVLDEPLSIPNDAAGYDTSSSARVLPCVINSGSKAIPGGVQVKMRRTFTAVPDVSSPPPLEITSDRRINVIKNIGTSPVTVYVNYYASDWRNLTSWDAPVNNTVQLPVTGIDTASVMGILTNSNQTATPTLIPADVSTPAKTKAAEKGVIEFPGSSGSGARVRTIYRTIDEWTSQPSVAPRSYIPFNARRLTDLDFPREPWREYVWLPSDPSNIYFHASEAGKTVTIAYSYGATNTSTKTTLTINDIQDTPSPAGWPAGFTTIGKVARATLTLPNGDEPTGPDTTNAILSVQGLSVQARTAWLNADQYNQVIVPGYRNLLQ